MRSIESAIGVSLGSDAVLMLLTTSFAVIVGLVVFFLKRSSDRSKEVKPVVFPKSLNVEPEEEIEVEPGKVKVTVFFGTQTGTAEGFAKVKSVHVVFRCVIGFCRSSLSCYELNLVALCWCAGRK